MPPERALRLRPDRQHGAVQEVGDLSRAMIPVIVAPERSWFPTEGVAFGIMGG